MNFDVERSSVEDSASDSKMAKLNDKLKVELERVRREAEQRERRLLEAMEALEEKINDASERNSRRRRSKKEAAEKPNATTESSNWYDVGNETQLRVHQVKSRMQAFHQLVDLAGLVWITFDTW